MKRAICLVMLMLAFLQLAGAQPDPNQPPADLPDRQPQVAGRVIRNLLALQQKASVQSTPHGICVLRNGVLALLDAQTLKPKIVRDLFPPAAPPAPKAPFAAAADMPAVERMYPASLLLQGDDLLVLIGDHLFRVDTATLKLRYDADLTGPLGKAANRWRELIAPPTLELKGDTLYIVRTTQICAVNVRDGKLLKTTLLPPPLQQGDAVRAPQGLRDRPADEPPAAQAREVTLVGVIVKQDGHKPLWTLRTAEDARYILEGDTLDKLAAEGARARITGILREDGDLPDFAEGRLEIKEYQILPE
ncbi:MAG: hypothetical protein ACYC6A_19935 [Armatimonadota bacterium]